MPPRTPSRPPAATPAAPPTFVAIAFETADYGRDSACALARVGVEASADVATAVPLSAATASFTATAPHLSTCR